MRRFLDRIIRRQPTCHVVVSADDARFDAYVEARAAPLPTAVLRAALKEKPAVRSGGLPGPEGSFNERDDTMTVQPLFAKTPPPKKAEVIAAAEVAQLNAWLSRGKTEVFSVTTLVTPTMAAALLARNTGNRTVVLKGATRSVQAYAAAMKRGEWALNGEPIILSATGELNDGQHRLNAVVESGVSVQMLLTFGVERDTRHTVDQGVARTPGHILSMFGEKNTNQLATALQFIWAGDNASSLNARPSTDQLLETLERHPGLREAVRDVGHLVGEYRLSAGYIAGAVYRCRQHDPYTADQFLTAVTTGLNIQNVNSPVARLRRMFTEHCAKRQRKTATEQAANYIKAYNFFVRGRTGACVWKGNANEAFPTAGVLS